MIKNNKRLSPRQVANKAYTLAVKKLDKDDKRRRPQYSVRERLLLSNTMAKAEDVLNKKTAKPQVIDTKPIVDVEKMTAMPSRSDEKSLLAAAVVAAAAAAAYSSYQKNMETIQYNDCRPIVSHTINNTATTMMIWNIK